MMMVTSEDENLLPIGSSALPGNFPENVKTEGHRQHYFINEIVEWDLTKYIWSGTTDVALRDKIMSNATELIRQIIRKQRLHIIYPGHEESSFGDLVLTAWMQVERVLYKYRSKPHCRSCFAFERPNDSALYTPSSMEYGIIRMNQLFMRGILKCPHCGADLTNGEIIEPRQGLYGGTRSILYRGSSKVFNMWSQVSRTVILAYIKKEGRDKKNSGGYREYSINKTRTELSPMDRFITEASEVCRYNQDYVKLLAELKILNEKDDKPWDGLISKLVRATGYSRPQVAAFLKYIRLHSHSFSDSPISKEVEFKYGQGEEPSSDDD